ncbi:MAG: hypothetical protein WCO67_15795 [Betaproteobacteria bacterium]
MPTKAPQQFDVIYTETDDDDDDEKQTNSTIGRVEADANFILKVVSAVPDQKEFLDETVELVNEKQVLHVEAPAPKGAPKFAVASRKVERGTPEFAAELQTYLATYYDITLQAV